MLGRYTLGEVYVDGQVVIKRLLMRDDKIVRQEVDELRKIRSTSCRN
jgi:hypothetical protein